MSTNNEPETSRSASTPSQSVLHEDVIVWDVFVAREIAMLESKEANPQAQFSMRTHLLSMWQRLTKEEKDCLHYQTSMLQQIVNDTTQLRAFWYFFVDTLPLNSALSTRKVSVDLQAFFGTVRDQWVTMDEDQRMQYDTQAQESITTTGLPTFHTPSNASPEPLEVADGRGLQLDSMFDSSGIEELEAQRRRGLGQLSAIQGLIENSRSRDASRWYRHIRAARMQCVDPKVLVGVVGSTGTGKSSVINAFLEEEKLLPTSCWRACTAVVTEIAYNSMPGSKYRAEVVFISRAEWRAELRLLFADMADVGHSRHELRNQSSSAGIAFDKVTAVYPFVTTANIKNTSAEELLKHDNVRDLLDSTLDVAASTGVDLYRSLKRYIDSKEKNIQNSVYDDSSSAAIWPLIKVVRIYTPHRLLQGGLTIVDLPGIHDSNQARANIATEYEKNCSALWIVSPITRAVDDKSAKDLLGKAFKRQLALDGSLGSISFICSKTDEISINELQDSLGLDFSPFEQARVEAQEKFEAWQAEVRTLEDKVDSLAERSDDLKDEHKEYKRYGRQIDEGITVFAPIPASEKRKRRGSQRYPNKRRARTITIDSDDSDDEIEPPKIPLNKTDVEQKLKDIIAEHDDTNKQIDEIEIKVAELRMCLEDPKSHPKYVDMTQWQYCVAQRNDRSKKVVQLDYANGVKEQDHQLGFQANPENFDPRIDVRDYDQIARSLPVLCVSARGYQKLCGRLGRDKSGDHFSEIDQTGMPALQAHAETLIVTVREKSCKRFLNRVATLKTSIQLWASGASLGRKLSAAETASENDFLKSGLAQSTRGQSIQDKWLIDETNILQVLVVERAKAHEKLLGALQRNIIDALPRAATKATEQAKDISSKWAGIHWSTYRAICSRSGSFTNAKGHFDFNQDLANPMVNAITMGWEKTFSVDVPSILQANAEKSKLSIKHLHEVICERAARLGPTTHLLKLFGEQMSNREAQIDDMFTQVSTEVSQLQKDANRKFGPIVQRALRDSYNNAGAEHGRGSFARMRNIMEGEVDLSRYAMFEKARTVVGKMLVKMVDDGDRRLAGGIGEVCEDFGRDYSDVFASSTRGLNQHEMDVRDTLRKAIDEMSGPATFRSESRITDQAESTVEAKVKLEGSKD